MEHDEKYLKNELAKLTQENFYLRERIGEMEEFCDQAQKALASWQEQVQYLNQSDARIKYLENELDSLQSQINCLQIESLSIQQENDQLKDINSQLNSQKRIMEIELERMSHVLNSKNEQIWKMIEDEKALEKWNSYRVRETPVVVREKSCNKSLGSLRDFELRDKVFESQKNKMKSLASQSMSSKAGGASFRFSSPTRYTKCGSIGELKALIRQAQEMQMGKFKVNKFS